MSNGSVRHWLKWRPGQLARHGGALFGWMLVRAAAQAGIVILLARTLGAAPYGAFVATIAVAGFATPLMGLGLSHLVLRNGARDPAHLPHYLKHASHIWRVTLIPCTMLAFLLAFYLLPHGLPLAVVMVAIASELAATSLTELRARQYQAQHRINAYGAINAGLPTIRLAALVLSTLLADTITLTHALCAYSGASLLFMLLIARLGTPTKPMGAPREAMSWRSGFPFSIAALSLRLQGEFNKPILARAGLGLAGNYNVAQRAVDMASLPLQALQESLWPRLYAQSNPMPQLRRMGFLLMGLACLLGCALWVTAPLIGWIVGSGYENAVAVLRLLAWLPVLQAARGLLNFHVIHHGRMTLIGWACAFGGLVSVLGTLLLVPGLGMLGAAAASYASEVAMIAFLLIATKRLSNQDQLDVDA